MEDNVVDARKELTTQEASQRSGLSRTHITYLLRQGKLEGRNFGHRLWTVYADSLENYLASPHKSGPKGPHKKHSVGTTDTTHSATDGGLNGQQQK
jgi:excisionase family DNA binding protein